MHTQSLVTGFHPTKINTIFLILAATLHVRVPPLADFCSAIMNAGFRVSQFHHEPSAIKTDAPAQVVSAFFFNESRVSLVSHDFLNVLGFL